MITDSEVIYKKLDACVEQYDFNTVETCLDYLIKQDHPFQNLYSALKATHWCKGLIGNYPELFHLAQEKAWMTGGKEMFESVSEFK